MLNLLDILKATTFKGLLTKNGFTETWSLTFLSKGAITVQVEESYAVSLINSGLNHKSLEDSAFAKSYLFS